MEVPTELLVRALRIDQVAGVVITSQSVTGCPIFFKFSHKFSNAIFDFV